MSNEAAITSIETVKRKLKKYTALKENEKVKEYLRKLHHTSVTPSLIQETKIDLLIRHLASNKTASYSSSARKLLKKWHHKKLLSKPTSDINQIIIEKKPDELSESQSPDDTKKRKVLSLAQYLENKKHILSSSTMINTRQNKLTDTQIEVINAQFKAATEQLTASATDLASIVNKNLIEPEKKNGNRTEIVAKKTSTDPSKTKLNDLWAEDDDDDDDDDNNIQSPMNQSRTVNSNDSVHLQKVR